MYHQLLMKKPETSIKLQIKELVANDMMKTLFSNLSKVATISLSIPVAMALISRNKLFPNKDPLMKQPDKSLSYLMKISIESRAELMDSHLEEVIDV